MYIRACPVFSSFFLSFFLLSTPVFCFCFLVFGFCSHRPHVSLVYTYLTSPYLSYLAFISSCTLLYSTLLYHHQPLQRDTVDRYQPKFNPTQPNPTQFNRQSSIEKTGTKNKNQNIRQRFYFHFILLYLSYLTYLI